jgi:peptidoglycan/xylan/chitin deacetylase (PgdA/CDA1 family)
MITTTDMKAIMYHYVRPDDPALPYFRHLHVDDFTQQLDYFGDKFGFVSQSDFLASLDSGDPTPGVVLTFDDGFKDHHQYVLPNLLQRGLWGIFYIPTAPFETGKLIDVHRIHMLVGKYGGTALAETIQKIITEEMLSHEHIQEFHTQTYSRQQNDANTNYVKRLLNYFIDYKYREQVIDQLMELFFPNEASLIKDFYMTPTEIREMQGNGMLIGSHSANHPVMSKLTSDQQAAEIFESFSVIEAMTGPLEVRTFCYPYGGFHSFSPGTETLLEAHNCRFAFNVESRDITSTDLHDRPQALPRYDCNQFPYGSYRERS